MNIVFLMILYHEIPMKTLANFHDNGLAILKNRNFNTRKFMLRRNQNKKLGDFKSYLSQANQTSSQHGDFIELHFKTQLETLQRLNNSNDPDAVKKAMTGIINEIEVYTAKNLGEIDEKQFQHAFINILEMMNKYVGASQKFNDIARKQIQGGLLDQTREIMTTVADHQLIDKFKKIITEERSDLLPVFKQLANKSLNLYEVPVMKELLLLAKLKPDERNSVRYEDINAIVKFTLEHGIQNEVATILNIDAAKLRAQSTSNIPSQSTATSPTSIANLKSQVADIVKMKDKLKDDKQDLQTDLGFLQQIAISSAEENKDPRVVARLETIKAKYNGESDIAKLQALTMEVVKSKNNELTALNAKHEVALIALKQEERSQLLPTIHATLTDEVNKHQIALALLKVNPSNADHPIQFKLNTMQFLQRVLNGERPDTLPKIDPTFEINKQNLIQVALLSMNLEQLKPADFQLIEKLKALPNCKFPNTAEALKYDEKLRDYNSSKQTASAPTRTVPLPPNFNAQCLEAIHRDSKLCNDLLSLTDFVKNDSFTAIANHLSKKNFSAIIVLLRGTLTKQGDSTQQSPIDKQLHSFLTTLKRNVNGELTDSRQFIAEIQNVISGLNALKSEQSLAVQRTPTFRSGT